MGKRKRDKRLAGLADAAVTLASSEPEIASRHGFDTGGLLGHESTYSVNVTEQVSMAVDVVFACVRLLQAAVADADVGEFRDTERLPDSRLTRKPMQSMTRRSWIKLCVATMALYNGVYLVRSTLRDSEGVPMSLVPVAPTRVQWENATTVRLDAERIDPDRLVWVPRMHFPTLTRELAYTIRLARESIASSWSADSYRSDFWSKGGVPPWYVSTDQALTNDDADSIKARIKSVRSADPGDPLVLGKGAKPGTVGADLAAEGASEALSRLGTSIARYFGVHAYLVNVKTEAGNLIYQNAAAAGLDLVRFTLQPDYAGPLSDALSEELPGDAIFGRRVIFDLRHLTRGTILEEAQAYQIALGGMGGTARAWMTVEEVRADLHMPMDPVLNEDGARAPAMEAISNG